jgi:hypothetical protein
MFTCIIICGRKQKFSDKRNGEESMNQKTFAINGPVLMSTGQIEPATIYISEV